MRTTALVLVFMISVSSCSLFDNFDENPMYLGAEEISLDVVAGQGVGTHDIKDIWVFVDGFSVGIFELPDTIPVLAQGDKIDLDIFAGIRNNGILSDAFQYPFIDPLTFSLDYEANVIKPVNLEFKYNDNTTFQIIEDFENGHDLTEDLDGDPSTSFYISDDTPYGQFCGKLDARKDTIFKQSGKTKFNTEEFKNSAVFLEMDYKTDVRFGIGFTGYRDNFATEVPVYLADTTSNWEKLYLDLSVELNGGVYDEYKLLFTNNIFPLQDAGSIWIDNVKIVYLDR